MEKGTRFLFKICGFWIENVTKIIWAKRTSTPVFLTLTGMDQLVGRAKSLFGLQVLHNNVQKDFRNVLKSLGTPLSSLLSPPRLWQITQNLPSVARLRVLDYSPFWAPPWALSSLHRNVNTGNIIMLWKANVRSL